MTLPAVRQTRIIRSWKPRAAVLSAMPLWSSRSIDHSLEDPALARSRGGVFSFSSHQIEDSPW